jgi:hypothetical protein
VPSTTQQPSIGGLIAPFERRVAQLDAVPGLGRVAAQDLVAEVGVDMSVFATPANLVSWAKFCPQVKQSAGREKGRGSRGKGNRYLAGVLGEATQCRRDQDTYRRPLPAPGQAPGQGQGQPTDKRTSGLRPERGAAPHPGPARPGVRCIHG